MKSPLQKFAFFYFAAGLVIIALYAAFVDASVAWFLAFNWLAVGIALALITYGLPRKPDSEIAALIYWIGVAWLTLLFAGGIFLIWNKGIGVQELQLLLD